MPRLYIDDASQILSLCVALFARRRDNAVIIRSQPWLNGFLLRNQKPPALFLVLPYVLLFAPTLVLAFFFLLSPPLAELQSLFSTFDFSPYRQWHLVLK